MTSLQTLYSFFAISIFLYIVAAVITASTVIPLQVKQARVRNGLATLRKQLLIKGVLAEVVIIASILALTARFFISDPDTNRYLITGIIFVHSVGILAKANIDYKIYHQQYTPEQKRFHELLADMEDKKVRKKGRK